MKRLILSALSVAILALGIITGLQAQTKLQTASASDTGKCYTTCTDPDRDQYDMWGNRFDAQGNLLQVSSCPYTDPISGKPNPYCHTDCQYPDRWSNPVDGCDNSDPAVPECIKEFSTKAGEDACIAAFVADQPNTAQPSEAAQSWGK